MNEIMKLINRFSLSETDKEILSLKLTNKKINNIIILQKKAYISLDQREMIIIHNVSKDASVILDKIKEKSNKQFISFDTKRRIKKKISWSNEDLEFLKENYNKLSLTQLSEILDKSYYQIQHKKISLNLYQVKPWSNHEVSFLKKNINKSLYFLSEELNRSIAAIKAKKRTLLNSTEN
ncbi:hypothetical protein H3N56_10935 [Cetobacterium sp. 2A]|uniref:hypothetical protein n=1 Tax=Cetobacterium sp. 2A TaxID=2754723 RepID=UPI00163C82A5|nr:hypothetical protein [Cetobacterium sp. 2A]MBC2856948.1 hypothetical protein [Cetobacterium sp. 2A]